MELHNAVLSSFKPYFTVLQVLGLFPFDLKELKYSKLTTQFSFTKFCFTVLIVFQTFTMFGLALIGASEFDIDYFAAVYWKWTVYISNMIIILQIVAQNLCSQKIVKIVENLMAFNLQMMHFGISTKCFIKFQNQCKKIQIMTICMMSLITGYCLSITSYIIILSEQGWKYLIYLHWGLTFELFYGCFNVTQFFIFAWLTSRGFICLRSHLEISAKKLTFDKLRKVAALFHQLCQVVKCINESLCELLNFTLAVTLLNEIFGIYSWAITMSFYSDGISMQLIFMISSSLLWLGVHVIRKCFISYAGSIVKSSIESLKQFVLQLIHSSNDELLRNELRCMLFQMECGPKNLENSFFVIDWKLIFMVNLYGFT